MVQPTNLQLYLNSTIIMQLHGLFRVACDVITCVSMLVDCDKLFAACYRTSSSRKAISQLDLPLPQATTFGGLNNAMYIHASY